MTTIAIVAVSIAALFGSAVEELGNEALDTLVWRCAVDSMCHASSMPALRHASDLNEELRVWVFVSWDYYLLRIQLEEKAYKGDMRHYRDASGDDENAAGEYCRALGFDMQYVERKIERGSEPGWSTVVEKLESLGVWDLPDQGPTFLDHDGAALFVEFRRDGAYHSYLYHIPRDTVDSMHATAISMYVLDVIGVENPFESLN